MIIKGYIVLTILRSINKKNLCLDFFLNKKLLNKKKVIKIVVSYKHFNTKFFIKETFLFIHLRVRVKLMSN